MIIKTDINLLRPRHHLNAAVKLYPNAAKLVEEYRMNRGKDLPKWPAWCFWHGYWRGPRDSERKFIYKWISPLFINTEG